MYLSISSYFLVFHVINFVIPVSTRVAESLILSQMQDGIIYKEFK